MRLIGECSKADGAMTDSVAYQGLLSIADQIRSGETTSREVTTQILARIDRLNPELKAYATVTPDHALAKADAADRDIAKGVVHGQLHGVPVAVKDLCFTKGVRTMGGTAALKDHIPDFSATVVERLAAAGAVLLGKLNTTEGAMAGYNPEFDAPMNPWNADRWSGVSSSGSGVAVAAGLCYGAIGTDTGGSIRFPSAANGTVGLKPTWGRVSRYGVLNLAESLDHVGPLTRRVEDSAAFLEVIAGHDPHDPTSTTRPVPSILKNIDRGVKNLRIGFDEDYLTRDVNPETSEAVRAAIGVLEYHGAKRVDVTMPALDEAVASWSILCSAEAALAHEATYPSKADSYGPWFRTWLDIGRSVSGADYARANNVRNALRGTFAAIMEQIDVLACPSTAFPAHPITRALLYGPLLPPEPGDPTSVMMRYTVPADFTGHPTLSVPCGFTRDGLPLSLQLIGQLWEEDTICRAGYTYQNATDWHTQHPELE